MSGASAVGDRGPTRIAAAIPASACLALLAAACGGAPAGHVAQIGRTRSTTVSRVSQVDGALAFSRCMRSHGLTQFPDPDSSGVIPKVSLRQLGVAGSRFQAARTACMGLLRPSTAQVRQTMSGMLDFAHCMRSHGAHAWPDPTLDGDGNAVFDLRGRIDPDTPRMDATSGTCSRLLHPVPGQNGTVLCNGIGEDGCHHYG